jgi:hypothetical protein
MEDESAQPASTFTQAQKRKEPLSVPDNHLQDVGKIDKHHLIDE